MKFKRENSVAKSQIHIDEQKNAINTIEIDISPGSNHNIFKTWWSAKLSKHFY